MGHEIARLLLEKADTFLSRKEAINTALNLGMPLHEIEDYLDWLDMIQGKREDDEAGENKKDNLPTRSSRGKPDR